MNIMTFKTWLKVVLWAVIIHIMLIAISVLEVFIYSQINPNQDTEFYTEHAKISGPYISIFFGLIIFYFVARSLSRNFTKLKIVIALSLPIIYTIMDFIMVHYSGVDWKEHLGIFLISFCAKVAGSLLGTFVRFKRK